MERVKIVECPRDAWQGLLKVIPSDAKVSYLRKLMELGFRNLDAVSFVSPKYVPQMADSEAVMLELSAALATGASLVDPDKRNSKLEGRKSEPAFDLPPATIQTDFIGIVVNEQGLDRALRTPGVTTIGYPYSISANFRRQNANMGLAESRALVEKLQQTTKAAGRNLTVYISMAFGNPFGEPWSPEVVENTLVWLKGVGVATVSLADTVGLAQAKGVGDLYRDVNSAADGMDLGVHLHSRPESAGDKVLAAFEAGCRRFDCALTGLGGCPFAGDEMVGNIPTEIVVAKFAALGVETGIEPWALLAAVEATKEIRGLYM
ncbi:MAG TPA: hydroxymethylglutaryl-CoA lyase [Terriglobia bacterium]|nr:hydroxymethylglutaryl-CoA lyase [Terriglobia bacterium]